MPGTLPDAIGVRGARHNNLRDVDVDVPLWRTVAVVGVSGGLRCTRAANERVAWLSVNYDNAVASVERSLRSGNERTRRLARRFVITRSCSVCHGIRLRPEALASQLGGRNSAETGERQRIELTSTVRASTTGMLYVLDEPSVGLHPSNVTGLRKMISALAGNGNSVIVVERERELIRLSGSALGCWRHRPSFLSQFRRG